MIVGDPVEAGFDILVRGDRLGWVWRSWREMSLGGLGTRDKDMPIALEGEVAGKSDQQFAVVIHGEKRFRAEGNDHNNPLRGHIRWLIDKAQYFRAGNCLELAAGRRSRL